MALQILTDQPAKHEQTAAAAGTAAASHCVNSAAAAKAVGAMVSTSSEPNGGAQVEKQQHDVAAVAAAALAPSDTADTGANAEAVATKPPVTGARAAFDTPSSVDVLGVNAVLTAGKADEEANAAPLQGSNKATLGETLRVPNGERSGSFTSTCDDTPLSRTSNGSTCSWGVSGGVAFTSPVNRHVDAQSPPFSAQAAHVSDFFRSSYSSSSTSNGSPGTSSTVSESASSGGNPHLNDCDSNLKGVSSSSSEESHLGSSLYCSRTTSNAIKGSGTSESNLTCMGSNSSNCESTRVSLDSTLVSYENNRTSDSSGSSFEGRFTKENSPGTVKRPQQQLEEEQREAGLLQPHGELPLLDLPTRVKKHERGNSLDRCVTYHGTPLNTPLPPDVQTIEHDDLLLSVNNINSSPNGSSRRRSSSCSVSSKENTGRIRLTSGHVRLPQPHTRKEVEQLQHERSGRDGGGWAGGSREVFSECAVEREKPGDSFCCKRSSTGVGGGSPNAFAAESQAKNECVFSTASKQGVFTEEFEYISKKSCLGLEHGGWTGRQRLSTSLNGSPREATPTGDSLVFRNYCSSPRFHGNGSATGLDADAGVGVLTSSLSAPEKTSSSRQGNGMGDDSSIGGSPLFGVHTGVQQLHQANRGSNFLGRPVLDEAVPRSPGRSEIRTPKVSGEDRKIAGERGAAIGRGGETAERTSSATKETAACKREDRWTSPFPGVKYCRSRNAWIARWSESGQEKWKTFPVKDSSFEEARRRALEFRQEKDRRKFERLWQQLNAEGLTGGSNGEKRNTVLSPRGGKLSGSDSSSGEGSTARNRVPAGTAVGERNITLRNDTKSLSAWQQQHSEGSLDYAPVTPRLTRLSAFRSTRLLQSTQRQQQRKQEVGQQRPQLQDMMGQEGISCETSRAESISKDATNTNRSAGCEALDSLGDGRPWLTPAVYAADACPRDGSGKEETPLSPGHISNGWQQRTNVSTTRVQLQGTQNAFSTDSTNSLVSPEPSWLLSQDAVRLERTPGASPKAQAVVSYREAANSVGGKAEASPLAGNGPIHHQQHSSQGNGVALPTGAAELEGSEGLAGGRVVEALLRVLSGEDANARQEGRGPEKIAVLLGDHGRAPVDALARLPADDMPVSRKRRSRDDAETGYTGSESTTAESVTPTSLKILSMYKAALLLIMDDLMSNGLPLLIASGGGAPLGTEHRHLPLTSVVGEGEVQLGDRKAMVEHSMRKMLEDQRRCIAEASVLGAVSPFVRLFETCILDQKLPSQADDSGRTQLVYLNALSALQELSLSVKGGSSVLW